MLFTLTGDPSHHISHVSPPSFFATLSPSPLSSSPPPASPSSRWTAWVALPWLLRLHLELHETHCLTGQGVRPDSSWWKGSVAVLREGPSSSPIAAQTACLVLVQFRAIPAEPLLLGRTRSEDPSVSEREWPRHQPHRIAWPCCLSSSIQVGTLCRSEADPNREASLKQSRLLSDAAVEGLARQLTSSSLGFNKAFPQATTMASFPPVAHDGGLLFSSPRSSSALARATSMHNCPCLHVQLWAWTQCSHPRSRPSG
jgi:hypothetical protein